MYVDSSAMRLKHMKCLRDVGRKRCPGIGLCSNAAMDRWHDLKLPRGAYLNFMLETLVLGLAFDMLKLIDLVLTVC